MGVRNMQGTPAHLETIKTTDGTHRHPARCIYANGKKNERKCTCWQCPNYTLHCGSASRCDYYEDKNHIQK